MSHDQRPGKMRVVQDASTANRNRRSDVAAASGAAARAGMGTANGLAASNAAARNAAGAKTGLPMLQAGLFLFACIVGGVAVAILRPF